MTLRTFLFVALIASHPLAQSAPAPEQDPRPRARFLILRLGATSELVATAPRSHVFTPKPATSSDLVRVALIGVLGQVLAEVVADVPPVRPPHCGGGPLPAPESSLVFMDVPDLGGAVVSLQLTRIRHGVSAPAGTVAAAPSGGGVVASQIFVEQIYGSGPPANRFDIVLLGDGYTLDERGIFDARAALFAAVLVTREPY